MGANTAIIDACELGLAIVEGINGNLVEVLRRYQDIMVPRGRQMVLESRATAESEDSREIAGGRMQ